LNSEFRSARVGPNGASYSTEFADSEPQTGESGVNPRNLSRCMLMLLIYRHDVDAA
jgi:hypothetical protein